MNINKQQYNVFESILDGSKDSAIFILSVMAISISMHLFGLHKLNFFILATISYLIKVVVYLAIGAWVAFLVISLTTGIDTFDDEEDFQIAVFFIFLSSFVIELFASFAYHQDITQTGMVSPIYCSLFIALFTFAYIFFYGGWDE